MPERRSGASLAGLLGALLVIGGLVVRSFPAGPGSSSSIEEHVRWLQSQELLTQLSVSWLLATVGAMLIFWGLADIRRRLGKRGVYATTTFLLAAFAFLVLLLLGSTLAEALPAAGFFDAFSVDAGAAQTLLLIAGAEYILTVQAAWFGALAVLIGSVGLMRAGDSPRWLGWLGIILALVTLATSPFSESTAAGVPLLWIAVVMLYALLDRSVVDVEAMP